MDIRATLAVCLVVLYGAAMTPAAAADEVNASEQVAGSRIRLFGKNGTGMWLYKDKACYKTSFFKKVGAETVSGSIGQAISSARGKANNGKQGIPETKDSKDADSGGYQYYNEFDVNPDKPITILSSFGIGSWSCEGYIAATFTPKAGKDYEGRLDVNLTTKQCHLIVKEIQPTPEGAVLNPIDDLQPAFKCD
ncbi:hypothetical protein [Duganella sp. CF458]|uniref:hypothetical protein n=1 Tax=Duganella sp. CF458 TaxID=1884368 RepID=UPI00147A162C|nr:hypothetical protein [Duganella sp. CF458]